MFRPLLILVAMVLVVLVRAPAAQADEGMWTFDNFPLAKVNKAYGLRLNQAWIDHIRDTSVRLSSGCSAGVVSADGLIFTNQHCVMECAQELSSASQDHVAEGFLAKNREDELTCQGLSAEILTGISDVTHDIRAATQGLTGDGFVQVLNGRISEIEMAACGADRKRHCQVISLYQGGQYKLYQYRKYSDVRLVFVPEFQAAFFGGDPDNFNFPRYALDVAFLRLYDDGRVVSTPQHLIWNDKAPRENDPVFISGNPGKTERLLTAAQLESQRDLYLPMTQVTRAELRGRLIGFAAQSPENKRISTDPLFDVENAFKAASGQELTLRDPAMFATKRAEEKRLKGALKGRFGRDIGNPWNDLDKVQSDYKRLLIPYFTFEQSLNQSSLFMYARFLVRGAAERTKPSAERLSEYTDSRLPWIENDLFTATPIDKPLEELYLAFRLSKAREYLTADATQTKLLLGRASPETLARGLVAGTRLDDVTERQRLWDGGMSAILASDDPMIQYALRIDPEARRIRQLYEDRIVGPTRIAGDKIARVRFKVYGTRTYPDATWSPRLSYGRVKGWNENGTLVTPFTDYAGLYTRATGQAPYQLPQSFLAARSRIDGSVVLDYTTSNDISGGSSGSPAINADGEIVGTVFDGNIHCLGGYYFYDGALNRTIMVSTAAVSEALAKVYDAGALLAELRAGN